MSSTQLAFAGALLIISVHSTSCVHTPESGGEVPEAVTESSHVQTEVFACFASASEPAELRLMDNATGFYELTTREELAKAIVRRRAKEVTFRFSDSVPKEQMSEITEFLRGLGVRKIHFTIAPEPPHSVATRS